MLNSYEAIKRSSSGISNTVKSSHVSQALSFKNEYKQINSLRN